MVALPWDSVHREGIVKMDTIECAQLEPIIPLLLHPTNHFALTVRADVIAE